MKLEPLCPYCDGTTECEYLDIGVGLQQSTPFECMGCGSAQLYPNYDNKEFTEAERYFGWALHPSFPDKDLPNRKMCDIIQASKDEREKLNRNRLQRVE